MTSNTSAVAGSRSRKYTSRNVNNFKVRLCYMLFMLAAFKNRFTGVPFFSFLIYTISKEKKSDDGEGNDSPIASVVKKILEDSGAHNVEVNKRILNVFKKKISILHTAFKRASKSGPNYKSEVFYNEVDVLKLKGDCDRLRGEKRALEECVTEQAAKRICLEEKLKTALEKSQKKDEESKTRFKRLAKKVADMCLEKRSRGQAMKKSFRQYTRQHQARQKTVEGAMSHNPVIPWFV